MASNRKLVRAATQDNFVTEKIDVITNNLLGTYDDNGEYSIAPQIISELIGLKKIKKTSFANSVFCIGNLLGYGELVFELLFDSKSHNGKSATATLFLLEEVDKIQGYLQNTIRTKLEDYNENVDNFMQEAYDHFNILMSEEEDEDSEALERKLKDDIYNEDSYIVAKKQYSLMLDKLLEEKFLDAYGKYFTSRISALTKVDNEYTRTVLSSFNDQYALIQNVFLKEKNYKVLNELLDKCFEMNSGVNPAFEKDEQEFNNVIKPALDTFVENVNKLNDKFEQKALHMLDKEDRKKVEEILEEVHSVDEVVVDQIPNKQRAEEIVNEVPQSEVRVEKDNRVAGGREETHYIENIIKNSSAEPAVKEEKSPEVTTQGNSSFYESFTGVHRTSTASQKVVDTTRSADVETPNHYTEIARSSLQDRFSRLDKFKNKDKQSGENVTQDSAVSTSVYSNYLGALNNNRKENQDKIAEQRRKQMEQQFEDTMGR